MWAIKTNQKLILSESRVLKTNREGYIDSILKLSIKNGYRLPSNIELTELDILLKRLGEVGILDKLDLLYVFTGGGDTNFKSLNLVNLTKGRLTYFGGLTWSRQGVTGNGLNAYIDTNLVLGGINNGATNGNKYKLLSATRVMLATGAITSSASGYLDGNTVQFANRTVRDTINAPNTVTRINSSTNIGSLAGNFIAVTRLDKTIYKHADGVEQIIQDEGATSIGSYGTQSLLKGLGNTDSFTTNGLKFYALGEYLPKEDLDIFRTAFTTYLTNINAL